MFKVYFDAAKAKESEKFRDAHTPSFVKAAPKPQQLQTKSRKPKTASIGGILKNDAFKVTKRHPNRDKPVKILVPYEPLGVVTALTRDAADRMRGPRLRSPHKRSPRKPALNAWATAFNGITQPYRTAIDEASTGALDAINQELTARLANAAISGPAATQLAEVKSTIRHFTAPLSRDQLNVRFKNKDGGVRSEKISLNVMVPAFKAKVHEKEAELEGLWREWEHVIGQIAEVRDDIMDTADAAVDQTFMEMGTLRIAVTKMGEIALKEVEAEEKEAAAKQKNVEHNWELLLKAAE